jgi:hypothetical protein
VNVSVPELVRRDLLHREQEQTKRFGTPVEPYTGAEAILDAYEEAISLTIYLRQLIQEMTTSGLPLPPLIGPPSQTLLLPGEEPPHYAR